MTDEGKPQIEDCLYHRCAEHYTVPAQNREEFGGAECGGCIAAERDLIADVMWEVLPAHHRHGLTSRCEDCERIITKRLAELRQRGPGVHGRDDDTGLRTFAQFGADDREFIPRGERP